MKPEHSGSNLNRDTGEWAAPAEQQLRVVCREQRATIERLELENADLRRRLGEREHLRSVIRRQA